MKLIKTTFERFSSRVKEQNADIVCFGAGAIGRILVPYISNYYGLDSRIVCYIDNNKAKWNREIELSTGRVPIHSPQYLQKFLREGQNCNPVILITNGDFLPVIEQLEQMSEFGETECYLAPVMQLLEPGDGGMRGIRKSSITPLIPKQIHYCWFSGNPIPESLQKCIGSFKERCPDYEIIRWDETNYDVNKYEYTRQAYEAGKWGYIPDIARLEILYENGGFYLDTDVELRKSLDELRYQPAFCGREEWGHVNFGGGSGCMKHFELVGEILDFRKNVPFIQEDGAYNLEASGYYETKPLIDRGLTLKNRTEVVDEMTVYASEFFHPFNYITGAEHITEDTISIHHFQGGWLGDAEKRYRERTRKKFDTVLNSMRGL